MDFDFSTKAGWQKFFVSLITIAAMVATAFGVSNSDKWVTVGAVVAEFLAGIAFFIVNQNAAKGKAAATQAALETKADLIKTLAITAPEVAKVALFKVDAATVEPVKLVAFLKDKIKTARVIYGTWEGAKSFYLGWFRERFDLAIKRLANLNPTMGGVELVKKAVFEITGGELDDKMCQAIGQIPGYLGAVGAQADIKVISDLFSAIDNTKELAWMKAGWTKLAVRGAVKAIIDDATLRLQHGGPNDTVDPQVLAEWGLTQYMINASQFSGNRVDKIMWSTYRDKDGNPYPGTYNLIDFDPWAMAGVDSTSMEDI